MYRFQFSYKRVIIYSQRESEVSVWAVIQPSVPQIVMKLKLTPEVRFSSKLEEEGCQIGMRGRPSYW